MLKSKLSYVVQRLAAGILLSLASAIAIAQGTAAKDGVIAANRALERAFSSSNSIAIASQYTRDAELILYSDEVIRDRTEIEAFFKQFLVKSGASQLKLETVKTEEIGPFLNETGKFTASSSDGTVILDGRYIAIWRLEDDKWRIQVHAFHTNRRPGD